MKNLILLFCLIPFFCFSQAIPVEIISTPNGFELLRDGKPYYIKGVGGSTNLERAKEYGANSLRTWSAEGAKEILDKAHSLGLTVCVGLWAQHERHGFDYSNKVATDLQLEAFKRTIDELKDHPALLMWAVGNEVDLFYSNFDVWKHIEDIAKMIKEKDPNHPVITVTAGLDVAEVKLIKKYAPSIDALGINTYGGIYHIAESIVSYGWDKPYMITEWGPNGHWESPNTKWNVPIEQTSTEKAKSYRERYDIIAADKTNCLGSYVFLWGQKQETSATWYGLFLEDGRETAVMDVLIEKWSGELPVNFAPNIYSFKINDKTAYESLECEKKSTLNIQIDIVDKENEKLQYQYSIIPESTDIKSGGDKETAPKSVWSETTSKAINKINSPSKSGKYRLFLQVSDDNGNAATANFPFRVL